MGKFVMSSAKKILETKTIYGKKKDPVWVYLEKEMLQNIDTKPYNEKVGEWLRFLKDLKHHYHNEALKKERRLRKEVGPNWYMELSDDQKNVLSHVRSDIYQDLLEGLPRRMRKNFSDLGITLKIPKKVLMQSMETSYQDPGIFFWTLYKAVYKKSPSELQSTYDMNARIMISCLVFIDMEECVETLDRVTHFEKTPSVEPEKRKRKYFEPKVKYGEYLQKMYVPLYTNQRPKKKNEPPPLGYKLKLRSQESYEKLCLDNSFLEKRLERNKRMENVERVCKYKFWEPPSTLRNTDPKMCAYVMKMRMLKMKAKPRFRAEYENVQFQIGNVTFVGGRPRYQICNVAVMPTGYIAINDGIAIRNGQIVTCIDGYWQYPRPVVEKCESKCNCMTKWEPIVMDFLKESKCKCGHLYDFYNDGPRNKENYFYPPTKHGPLWIDHAKIYQLDTVEDFIKDTVDEALKSEVTSVHHSEPTLYAAGLKKKDLLAAFLGDISDTPLMIPHLPQANLLNNLQEWARSRVKGKLQRKHHKSMLLNSQRRWLDLKHMDFRARAYRIPKLENMKWSHRKLIQQLFKVLLEDFVMRNRLKQVEQTRLWWSTTKYDHYPYKPFLDIFFTYMPGRLKDSYWINPYSSELTRKHGGKTCPLRN